MKPTRAKRDSLAHRIAQLRQQLGLTQAAFAHRIGVSRGAVGAYEAGTMAPRAKTLDRIAVVGSVTADWLRRGDRPAPVPPAQDPAWGEAVAWLRQAWPDPGRRETVVGVLKALAATPRPPGHADRDPRPGLSPDRHTGRVRATEPSPRGPARIRKRLRESLTFGPAPPASE